MVLTIVRRAVSDARFGDMYALPCQRFVVASEWGEEFRQALVEEILWACDVLLEQTQLLLDDSHDDSSTTIQPSIALEGLCLLLTTCGQTLEGTVTSFGTLQTCWNTLQTLTVEDAPHGNRLSFRMRHIVLELLELPAAAWQPTRYGARRRQALVTRPIVVDPDRVPQSRRKKKNNNKKKNQGILFASNHQATAENDNKKGGDE
eukprot:scaffold630_cov174-Amphora_coffeaeformis.AAC.22